MIASSRHEFPRFVLLLASAAALGSSGCSLLFAPSRWQGGTPDDAGIDDGVDALVDPTTDAFVDPGADAFAPSDAFTPTPCADESMCALDEYCDGSVCRGCDADGDGLPARECAPGLFFDCDPEMGIAPTSVALPESDFLDTLRVFHVGGRTHLFWRNASGAMRLTLGVDSIGRRLEYAAGAGSPRPVTSFDAIRTRDGVIVAGYDRESLFRFDVDGMGARGTADRALAGAGDSGFLGLVPEGAPTLLRADRDAAFLGFPARYMDTGGIAYGGRMVLGIGNPHIARFHSTLPSPDDFRSASGNGLAVVPDDVGDGRSVYLWNGDLRSVDDSATPLLALPSTPVPSPLGQVAIGVGDGLRGSPPAINVVVALAHGSGDVRAELLRCPMDAAMPCTPESPRDYRIDGSEAGVVALAAPPSSGTTVMMLRSFPELFRVDMIDLEGDGMGTYSLPPEPDPMLDIPVPALSAAARALALDLALDTTMTPPRATLTLARAARRQIQTVTLDVCLVGP